VAEPFTVPAGGWLFSFDGRVFEVFSPYQEGSTRYHVGLMVNFWIDGSTLTANLQRNDIGLWPFTEAERAGVEELVAQVSQARARGVI
jgi:hypothetical protein